MAMVATSMKRPTWIELQWGVFLFGPPVLLIGLVIAATVLILEFIE